MGPSAGGKKLPPYALINRARDRGRGVRFTLHAEGRAANRGINLPRETAAKACAFPSAMNRPLTVHAAGRAADREIGRARVTAAEACATARAQSWLTRSVAEQCG